MHTVGAQSLAHTQSIMHGHIGDHICENSEIFEKLLLQKIKRGQFSSRFLNKKHIFSYKSGKKSCPKKVILIFFQNFATGEFFWTLKLNSQRSLDPMPTFPFPGGVMGNIF